MNHDEFEQLQHDIAVLAGCATAYPGDDDNDLDLSKFPVNPESGLRELTVR